MHMENVKSAIFIGHSTGASMSCWFARENPEMVQGLVLLAPSNGLPSFIRSMLRTNLAKQFILQLVQTEIGEVTINRCWHNKKSVPKEVIAAYKHVLHLKGWGDAIWAMSRHSAPKGFSECLKAIDVPVLMLHGDDDTLVGYQESVRVQHKFPDPATLKKIRDCGHLCMEECPKEFSHEVLAWINENIVTLDAFQPETFEIALDASKDVSRDRKKSEEA